MRTEKLSALGEPCQAESFFRSWRRHAVEQVIKAFQLEKIAEKALYQDNSYFRWIQEHPNETFPPSDPDPAPVWDKLQHARYFL